MTETPTGFNTLQPSTQDDGASRQWKKKEVIAEGFKNKTKGEATFNTISYVGVGYGLVTAVSVFMTWLLNDTSKFAEKFGKFATEVADRFKTPRSIIPIVTLFIGGSIASVLPVKWLEDKKPDIVRKLDRMYYNDVELNDQKIKAAHKELDEMPKQTWASVLGSRVVAFAATFGIFFLMGSNKSPLYKHTGQSIDKLSTQFGRWFDRTLHSGNAEAVREIEAAVATNKYRMTLDPLLNKNALKDIEVVRDKIGGDRIASRVWSYIGLDAFYTAITSASLFVFTRVFGGLFGKTEAQRKTAALTAPTIDHSLAADASPDKTEAVTTPNPAPTHPKPEKPGTQVGQKVHIERVTNAAREHEVTA